MELLYIWVENDETGFIREQGFNFSPKYNFRLSATEDGHYELSCTENRKCYNVWKTRNIVGLSAIVGENGSGKTVLLRHLLESSMGPLEYDKILEVNESRKKKFASKLMIKIYRRGGVICIYHNFPYGTFVNHTPYQVQKMTTGNSVVLNQEMNKQTRIYMTNGFRHQDSRHQSNVRHKRPDCVRLRKRCSGYSLLIERIGEPVVRRRLQMLYDEVFTEDSQDEYDRYLTEFDRLRKSKDPADQKKYQELLRIMGTKSTGA